MLTDQCCTQPLAENIPPGADGENTETHSQKYTDYLLICGVDVSIGVEIRIETLIPWMLILAEKLLIIF